MKVMERIFHIFEPVGKDIPIGLVEDGVPKAMAFVDGSLYPPHDEQEAMIFSIAVTKAFGKPFPVPENQKERPWVD